MLGIFSHDPGQLLFSLIGLERGRGDGMTRHLSHHQSSVITRFTTPPPPLGSQTPEIGESLLTSNVNIGTKPFLKFKMISQKTLVSNQLEASSSSRVSLSRD